jgi:hypothetical protein
MTLTRATRRWLPVLTACSLALLSIAPIARADEFVDRVNAAFKTIPADKRSDRVLLPLMAAMDATPAILKSQDRAALLGDKGPGWSECAEWAQKPAQKAVLEALEKVTKEEDRLKAYAFAQPYGAEAMGSDKESIDLLAKNLYTELGEPPLLAAANFGYLTPLENVGILTHVEASRRAEAGDISGAMKVITDWLFFCRQIADRPFLREKKWAMESMKLALERIRDIGYQDFRSESRKADASKLRETITRLRERRGFLLLDRITLPEADFVASEQLLALVMTPSGAPDPDRFGRYLARASAADRPLRLFSSSAYWDLARTGHANLRDSNEALRIIRGDWYKRWELNPFDRMMGTVTDYRKRVVTSPKFATLIGPYKNVDELFSLRQQLRAELGGTRMALGVLGYTLRQKTLPQGLAATRPEFIDTIDKDPYSKKGQDLRYFVAQRDTTRPGEEPRPHVIKLLPPPPQPTFEVPFGSDTFVIFSVGPDDAAEFAAVATQARTGTSGDYLLFPPTLSLFRQRLLETNQLK